MEDKRVRKTKKNLKQTLIALLEQKPFEQLSVTEICEAASSSRITFYTHYKDKYDLVEEIFRDMVELAAADFRALQEENNPAGELTASYCNLLDSILNLYNDKSYFFAHTAVNPDPYLTFVSYQYILSSVERYLDMTAGTPFRYTNRETAAFLCNGLGGFIDACRADRRPIDETREKANALLRSIIASGILSGEGR